MARRRKEEDASVQAQAEIEAMMTMVENRTQETLIQAETLLQEVRMDLEDSNVRAANRELNKAESMLDDINRQVFGLRRNTAMFNRLMSDRRTTEDELMRVLRGMRDVASHAENGHINAAAAEIGAIVGELIGADTRSVNPFLFRTFWMATETRWPAGADYGVLIVELRNDGDKPLPPMRLEPPLPTYWSAEPANVDVPKLNPGGFLPLQFRIKPPSALGSDDRPINRFLGIQTGYQIDQGVVDVTVRVENTNMSEILRDIVLNPWLPPGFTVDSVPVIERLAPGKSVVITYPLEIDVDGGLV